MPKPRSCTLLGCSFLLLALFFAPPALGEADNAAATLVKRYVSLSNQRDYEGLMDIYVRAPEIVREGELMQGEFAKNLKRDIEAWNEREAAFELVEMGEIEIQGDTATVPFTLRASGRYWFMRLSRTFSKELHLVRRNDRWLIVKDITR